MKNKLSTACYQLSFLQTAPCYTQLTHFFKKGPIHHVWRSYEMRLFDFTIYFVLMAQSSSSSSSGTKMSCSSKRAAKFLLIRVPTYRKGTTTAVMRMRPNGVWKTSGGSVEMKRLIEAEAHERRRWFGVAGISSAGYTNQLQRECIQLWPSLTEINKLQ